MKYIIYCFIVLSIVFVSCKKDTINQNTSAFVVAGDSVHENTIVLNKTIIADSTLGSLLVDLNNDGKPDIKIQSYFQKNYYVYFDTIHCFNSYMGFRVMRLDTTLTFLGMDSATYVTALNPSYAAVVPAQDTIRINNTWVSADSLNISFCNLSSCLASGWTNVNNNLSNKYLGFCYKQVYYWMEISTTISFTNDNSTLFIHRIGW